MEVKADKKNVFNSKAMKALGINEGVKIGAVIVKKNKEDIELPIILCKISCNIVNENGKFLGILGECRYNNRKVYQYISREKAEEIGLSENNFSKYYTVKIRKGGQGGKGESMSLISYVALKDNIRGNNLFQSSSRSSYSISARFLYYFSGVCQEKSCFQKSKTVL